MSRHRPVVIALSGLDGAGKSSQAALLATRLAEAGHSAGVHWMALGHSSAQRRLKRVLAPLARGRAVGGETVLRTAGGTAKNRRRHHPLLTQAWVTVLALIYGVHFRRVARSAAHEVVIFDRYALDALAQARYFYAPDADFAVARSLLRLLAPRPDRSYLLSVAPAVALARKQEQYDAGQLDLQARLLIDEAARMRVRVLDGERPSESLSDALVADTLSALSSQTR